MDDLPLNKLSPGRGQDLADLVMRLMVEVVALYLVYKCLQACLDELEARESCCQGFPDSVPRLQHGLTHRHGDNSGARVPRSTPQTSQAWPGRVCARGPSAAPGGPAPSSIEYVAGPTRSPPHSSRALGAHTPTTAPSESSFPRSRPPSIGC
jgi:hypothetical protein